MLPNKQIQSLIHVIRDQRVILDSDLSAIYGVPTKRLNEQVKRNRKRFPADFMFQLSVEEMKNLKSQFATSSGESLRSQNATLKSNHGGKRHRPYAFTEHGALMAANVLNSPRAVAMSVYVIRVFVRIRETVIWNDVIEKRFSAIEKVLLNHDEALRKLLIQIKPLLMPPPDKIKKRIGFHSSHAPQFAIH
jgi:hypothetical protein